MFTFSKRDFGNKLTSCEIFILFFIFIFVVAKYEVC